MTIKIATWNVNSIRVRLDRLKDLVRISGPDVVCLQEVKATQQDFPFDSIKEMGFEHIALYSMAGYNGVAILSKLPLSNIKQIDFAGKSDARHIQVKILNDIEINNIYIPAGGDIPDINENPSFAYKLDFINSVTKYFKQNEDVYNNKKVIVCGDFNVAPLENDVWGHKQLLKTVSHTPIEIESLEEMQKSINFTNAIRKVYPEPQKVYSWWSYRNPNWKINDKGRLLDHIWVSKALEQDIIDIDILKSFRDLERPSDHVPVIIEIKKQSK